MSDLPILLIMCVLTSENNAQALNRPIVDAELVFGDIFRSKLKANFVSGTGPRKVKPPAWDATTMALIGKMRMNQGSSDLMSPRPEPLNSA